MAFPLRLLLPLLLVLVGAVPVMGTSTTADLETTCPAETTITDVDDQETISYERWAATKSSKTGYVFVHPDEGFKGVTLRATLRKDTPSNTSLDQENHEAFFPLPRTCFKHNTTWWWEVGATVQVISRNNSNSNNNNNNDEQDLLFFLGAGECMAICTEQLHDTKYKSNKILDWPVMIAQGQSRWTKKPDTEKCKTSKFMDVPLKEYNSCIRLPGATQDKYNYTIALMTTLTVLTVTVTVLAYFVGKEADHIREIRESYSSG